MKKESLFKELFGNTLDYEKFIDEYYCKKPFQFKGSVQKAEKFLTRQDFEKLITSDDASLHIMFPDRGNLFLEKNRHFPDFKNVTSKEANIGRHFGGYLRFANLENLHKPVATFGAGLKNIFNILGAIETQGWHSMAGEGVELHTDATHVFSFQIYGTKKWRISKGSFEDKKSAFRLTNHRAILFNESPGNSDPFPDYDMNFDESDLITVLQKPGDILYIPPFCWHETTTEGDDLYNITINARYVQNSLHNLLDLDIFPDPRSDEALLFSEKSGDIKEILAQKLEEMKEYINNVNLEDLEKRFYEVASKYKGYSIKPEEEVKITPDTVLVRNRGMPLFKIESNETMSLFFNGSEYFFDEKEWLPFCEKIASCDSFTAKEATKWAPSGTYDWETILEYLIILVQADMFEVKVSKQQTSKQDQAA